MFEAVRSNKRIAQVILALISLTFAFWGVESYLSDRTSDSEVATVGDSKISAREFEQALRDQQDRLRAANEGQIDSETFNSPLFRRAVLDNLVNQRLLAIYAGEYRLSVSDEQLRDTIAGIEAFQENGQFSRSRYEAMLRGRGMNELAFQERVRAELANQQVLSAIGEAALVPSAVARRLLAAQLEERTVHMAQYAAADFAAEAKIDPEAVKAHYEASAAQYAQPARVKASYLVLDAAALRERVSVSEDDVRAEYEQSKDRFGVEEERKVSHILVQVPADAAEAEIAAAKEKAERLQAEVAAEPASFGAVAKRESDDPGSAENGGDLGFFGRGAMVQAFEEAVFAASEGLLDAPVRTEFGFHVIRVDEIRPATIPPLEEVRARIEGELRDKAAGRRFLEVAEQFANIVYEQPDSLEPAAQEFGLEVKHDVQWIERSGSAVGGYESQELVSALFSKDVLESKHNTDAIDVGNNTLVAARVDEYEPARQRSFDEVSNEIEVFLKQEAAVKLAREKGEAHLAELQAGKKPQIEWGESVKLQRGVPMLPPQVMATVFSVPEEPLPGYTGVALPGAGYALFRVDAVKHAEIGADDPRLADISQQYGQLLGAQDLRAFLSALRAQYPVKINAAAIDGQ